MRVFITGGSGFVGGHLIEALASEHEVLAMARSDASAAKVEILGAKSILTDLETVGAPDLEGVDVVIHAAAFVEEWGPESVYFDINVGGTTRVLDAAKTAGVERFILVSTNTTVFDGLGQRGVDETSAYPEHQSFPYGASKAEAERRLARREHVVIVRLPLLYGLPATARSTTFVQQLAAARSGEPVRLFDDEYRTPVYLPDAARAVIALAREGPGGQIVHVAGPQRLSRYDLVARIVELLDIRRAKLERISRLSIDAPEPRPADLSLDGSRFCAMFPHCAPRSLGPELARAWTHP